MTRWMPIAALAFSLASLHATPSAAQPKSCENPRRAVETLFAWQQPATFDLERASLCLDPSERTSAELQSAARALRSAYDSRGLRVRIEELSDDPDYRDPHTGAAVLAPHSDLPSLALARGPDGQWRFTKSAIDRALRLDRLAARPVERLAERLPAVFHGDLFGVKAWQYLALFLVVLVAFVVRKIIAFVIVQRVGHVADKLGQAWAASWIKAFASPGATVVMAVLLRLVYPALGLPLGAAHVMNLLIRVLIVTSLVWTAYGLVDVFAAHLAKKAASTESKLDDQLVPLVRRMMKVVVLLSGGVFILQNLEIDVGSLLAGLGIGGLAFALAAKDTLANFFGSVMIFIDKPFQIGDWVRIGDIEGVVEEVGFRTTRIRTFYNSLISVPNAKFTESSIDNYGMRQFRRTTCTLNLTYDTTPEQMQAFCDGVRAILEANEYTRKDFYEVHMSGFGAHSLDVLLYFFLRVPDWSTELRERHRIYLEIMRLAASLKVSFAYPTQTLLVDYVRQPGAARELPKPLSESAHAEVVRAFGPGGRPARAAS